MMNHTLKKSNQRPRKQRASLVIGRLPIKATAFLLLVGCSALLAQASENNGASNSNSNVPRSTQPTLDRQVETPGVPAASGQQQAAASAAPSSPKSDLSAPANQLSKQSAASSALAKAKQAASSAKKSSLASQQNYDKYQLKATNSYNSNNAPAVSAAPATQGADSHSKEQAATTSNKAAADESNKSSPPVVALKKSAGVQQASGVAKPKQSSFSLLKKFLPSFMTSAAGPMAAAAAAAASAVADSKSQHSQHSRSSQSALPADGVLSKASGKIINLLAGASKKMGAEGQAPFLVRKTSIDRQGGFASNLLSNPLSLGLLFSAPLIPSLLLTPLAIAGLSPAMSAINNFFGDDVELATSSAPAGPLSAMLAGGSSPLSNFLAQASGGSPVSSASGEQQTPSFALQAVQSLLGPPATTEKPLFNPGLFASQGISNAAGSLASSSSASSSAGSGNSNTPIRNFLTGGGSGGGSLMQAAASMISPGFPAPPAAGAAGQSAADSDDGPGFMQLASDVFDKVAGYMGSPSQAESNKDLAQASSSPGGSLSGPPGNLSPLSTLVGLSNFSPFQLSSLLASSPLASAIAGSAPAAASSSSASGSSSSLSSSAPVQKAGFFSTLRNVYELFSSSFLRRQEVGDSNECQQRLICELHQRAMNSKLFRRSLQSNLAELANLDRNLQEQIKANPIQARIDNDTKQMLNDFLKATNNFRAGRELVNCSKMYPKCSRAMLLSAANAHLADPVSGKAISKFSNLMKKMKYKSAQQHQSQWKLRKPTRSTASIQIPQEPRVLLPTNTVPMPPMSDHLQVAPMSPINGKAQTGSQLTPADSLKLVQQIMLMSQQQQQQQQQPQVQPQQVNQYSGANQYRQQQQSQAQYSPQQQQQVSNYNMAYGANQQQQYAGQQPQPTSYTDAVAPPMYSSTDSPYYLPAPQSQQQQQPQQSQVVVNPISSEVSIQQQQQQQQSAQNYQINYPTSMAPMEVSAAAEKRQQQPQQVSKLAVAA